jgi:ankyrin repeat protein
VRDVGASGDNALVIAVKYKHIDMLELLLTHSEHIDLLCGGQTLLHLCIRTRASQDMIRMIRMLLQHGANPEIVDHQGECPLQLAVRFKSLDMVNALLDGGANINKVNGTGNTALHVAVNHGFIAMSQLLRMRGADVDVVNAQGQTPRTIAKKWNLVQILEFL